MTSQRKHRPTVFESLAAAYPLHAQAGSRTEPPGPAWPSGEPDAVPRRGKGISRRLPQPVGRRRRVRGASCAVPAQDKGTSVGFAALITWFAAVLAGLYMF